LIYSELGEIAIRTAPAPADFIEAKKMRGKSILALALVVLSAGSSGSVWAQKYSGGTGEPNNPYRIATPNDLNDIGNHIEDFNKCFVLVNDINLADYNGTQFNIIGRFISWNDPNNRPFTGVFDGNGHTISNFSYTITDASYIGFFVYVAGVTEIKNLGLIDVNVTVVDSNSSDLSIYYCASSLIGLLTDATVSGCWAEGGNVSGDRSVGGLVGYNGGHIKDSHARVTVLGDARDWCVGGLVGENGSEGRITESYAAGSVTGCGDVGGLVGENAGKITRCYATGSISGLSCVGGLVGNNFYHITNSHATGDVSGGSDVGGLVGWNEWTGTVTNCNAMGDVTGEGRVGGLVGQSWRVVTNSYAAGSVSGTNKVGGLVGSQGFTLTPAEITNSYARGEVDGSTDVGGLVGDNYNGTISNSLWDTQTTGENNMCGDCYGSTCDYCDDGYGRVTAEMQTESTFTDAGWDFVEIWDIGENQTYPFLRVYPAGDLNHDGRVDFFDVAILADDWLEGTEP
jgi:hypothetical protein